MCIRDRAEADQLDEVWDVQDHQEVVGEQEDDREGAGHRAAGHDERHQDGPRETQHQHEHEQRNRCV